MTLNSLLSQAAATVFLGLVGSLSLASAPAHAEVLPNTERAVANAKSVAGHGAARFDWLERRNEAEPVRLSSSAPLGKGSWICSPAGFGSKSQCYKR